MRLTLHWRGQPLLALDLTAQSPEDDDESLLPPMGLSGASGGTFDMAEPMQPDTSTFGIGQRPAGLR